MDKEGKFMLKYINGGEELINYTDLINILNSINGGVARIWTFYKIDGHKKLPDENWQVKVIWDTGEET